MAADKASLCVPEVNFHFADGVPVLATPPPPHDDWHIDPAIKVAAAEVSKVQAAAAEVTAAREAKLAAKRGDGKASIVGASFNLSNAVSSTAAACGWKEWRRRRQRPQRGSRGVLLVGST